MSAGVAARNHLLLASVVLRVIRDRGPLTRRAVADAATLAGYPCRVTTVHAILLGLADIGMVADDVTQVEDPNPAKHETIWRLTELGRRAAEYGR